MPLISRDRRPRTAPDRRRTAHRGLASLTSLAVAVPIALVATAGPVGADETPPVRVTATTRVDAELFARDPALRGEPTFVTTTVDGIDGVAVSGHNWSTTPPAVGTSFSCEPTGCAGYDGRALADVDEAAGVLRAGAIANMYIGNPPQDGYGIAGYIYATGDAVIEDSITLSAPATVLLTGRLSGLLSATNTDSEEQGNDPEGVVLAQVQFLGERVWNGEGDGLPLAIELCAARAGSLPLALIRDRLAAHQPLPGSGPRDLPDRQRTIDAAVSWSHDLLEPPLQRLFARLAVFEESLDLQQAELVGGPPDELGIDVLDGLVRLTEHNLLSRVDDAVGGVRYGWLETIRAHALERLGASGERPDVEAGHTRAFASLASEAATHLPGGRQAWWLDRLAADDANLRAATRRAIADGDVEHAFTLVGSLWRYWLQTGRLAEGRDLVVAALALPGADAPATLRVRALDAAGGIAYWSGDMPKANAIYEDELALAREIGDRPGEAVALLDLFFTREFAGDIDAALAARSEAASIMRELGDDFGLARVTQSTFLIMFAVGREDPTVGASEMFEKADWLIALDDPWLARTGTALHAMAAWVKGDVVTAARWFSRGLRENLAVRERTEAALGMQFFVVAAPTIGHAEAGAVVHGACQSAIEELGIRPPASYVEMGGVDPLPMITAELGDVAYAAAVERGRRLSLEEALDFIEEVVVSLRSPT